MITLVQSVYHGLFENNLELLFKLKCRQFIEMIDRCDKEQDVPKKGLSTIPLDDKLLSYSKLHDETEKSSNASSIEVARKQNNSLMETNVSNWEFYMHK